MRTKKEKYFSFPIAETFSGVYDFIDGEIFDLSIEGRQRVGFILFKITEALLKFRFLYLILMKKTIALVQSIMETLMRFLDGRNKLTKQIQVNVMFKNPVLVERTSGELSSVDWDRIDKLKHFYSKFGFDVSVNNEKKEGSIKKQMKVDY